MLKSSSVIVALDTNSLEHVTQLMDQLEGVISFYKIGFELFTAHGWSFLIVHGTV